ncbi:MAG: hypothetical protein H6624_19160 [Bdellovibrionaceae bacterium]|nr:hypothetical protein [Bdellovibrionales bacterium]MCB9086468.1 hypothetical protein [Pseudobdellovibrionaceae bacterium]
MKKCSNIVKSEKSGDIVFDYNPKSFPIVITQQANDFLSSQGKGSTDFVISDLVAAQTGIADQQRKGVEDKIEEIALQRMQEIEEKAYKEAYDLGLIEGSEKAFAEKKEELEGRLNQLDQLLKMFDEIKKTLMADNERQLMELVVQVAGRIALQKIEEDPSSILKTMDLVLDDIHKDESVTIYLSKQDRDFLEDLRAKGGKKAEELRHVKLEAVDHIQSGGCQVETNYGVIDATLEQRIERVLSALREKMPRIKNTPSE